MQRFFILFFLFASTSIFSQNEPKNEIIEIIKDKLFGIEREEMSTSFYNFYKRYRSDRYILGNDFIDFYASLDKENRKEFLHDIYRHRTKNYTKKLNLDGVSFKKNKVHYYFTSREKVLNSLLAIEYSIDQRLEPVYFLDNIEKFYDDHIKNLSFLNDYDRLSIRQFDRTLLSSHKLNLSIRDVISGKDLSLQQFNSDVSKIILNSGNQVKSIGYQCFSDNEKIF